MHPDPAFRWNDRTAMRDFVRERTFGALFAQTPDGPRVVHLPAIWDGPDRLLFHLSARNALAPHLDGAVALFVANGPDAYVSPDWYAAGPDEVPTWNYVTVELQGRIRAISPEAMVAQIDALAAEREARLAPKPAWTRAKMDAGRFDAMTRAIRGFALDIAEWRGTRKLGQNKPEAARLAAAEALEAAGDSRIAGWMRTP